MDLMTDGTCRGCAGDEVRGGRGRGRGRPQVWEGK
jgi:hypothetical protein